MQMIGPSESYLDAAPLNKEGKRAADDELTRQIQAEIAQANADTRAAVQWENVQGDQRLRIMATALNDAGLTKR